MTDENALEITRDEDITVITFVLATIGGVGYVEDLSVCVRTFIEENKPGKLVIDFDQVKFLSSQMLGLLVDIWRRIGHYGGQMAISGINPQLSRVFRITNLDKIFSFYPHKSAALEALKSGEKSGQET